MLDSNTINSKEAKMWSASPVRIFYPLHVLGVERQVFAFKGGGRDATEKPFALCKIYNVNVLYYAQ